MVAFVGFGLFFMVVNQALTFPFLRKKGLIAGLIIKGNQWFSYALKNQSYIILGCPWYLVNRLFHPYLFISIVGWIRPLSR